MIEHPQSLAAPLSTTITAARRSLLTYARRLLGAAADHGEDVVHDGVLTVWLRRNEVAPTDGDWLRWLRRSVRDRAIDLLRRMQHGADDNELDVQASHVPGSDAVLALKEITHDIAIVLNGLSPRKRSLLLLSFADGLSPREIAARLHCAPKSVSNDLAELRAYLRSSLRVHATAETDGEAELRGKRRREPALRDSAQLTERARPARVTGLSFDDVSKQASEQASKQTSIG